jgi:hypothetical protein
MIRTPKIEKPSDMLIKLTRVEIICSVAHGFFLLRERLNLGSPVKFLRACVDNRKWNERPIAYPLAITHRSFGFSLCTTTPLTVLAFPRRTLNSRRGSQTVRKPYDSPSSTTSSSARQMAGSVVFSVSAPGHRSVEPDRTNAAHLALPLLFGIGPAGNADRWPRAGISQVVP